MPELLSIALIVTNEGCQPRAAIEGAAVASYAEDIEAGHQLPPVTVFYDGTSHFLADGYHRLGAHQKLGRSEIEADIRQGTLRDAVLYSLSANQTHGLRRTNGDKRRAVMRMLRDEEWAQWSDNAVAEHVGVSQPFVASIRKELNPPTSNGLKSDRPRITRSGRTINTANIGRKPAERAPVTRTSEHAQEAPDDDGPVREVETEEPEDDIAGTEPVEEQPVAQPGSAAPLEGVGRRFESDLADHAFAPSREVAAAIQAEPTHFTPLRDGRADPRDGKTPVWIDPANHPLTIATLLPILAVAIKECTGFDAGQAGGLSYDEAIALLDKLPDWLLEYADGARQRESEAA